MEKTKQATEKKVFGKSAAVLTAIAIFRIAITILFLAVSSNARNGYNDNVFNTIAGILILIGIYKILKQAVQKMIIEDDHITIKKGIIIKDVEDIKYKKINNIKISHAFGMGNLEVYTGNDKPIVFTYIDDPQGAKTIINDKIDEL